MAAPATPDRERAAAAAPHVVAAAVVALATACGGPAGGPPITADQEPVAVLALPASAQARVPVTVDAGGSLDVDGALAAATLSFGDDTPAVAVDLAGAGGAKGGALAFTHTWDAPGLYDVELAVTDDEGLTGRARARLAVAPPPDATPPVIASVALSVDGAPLSGGARVAAGSAVDVDVHASDPDGHLASADVTVSSSDDVGGVSIALAGADDEERGAVTLDAPGDVVVTVTAVDSFGNTSAPATISVHVLAPDEDSDGDGLPDVDDPAPDLYNGLTASLYVLAEDIPTDLFGNQRAEALVDDLDALSPAAMFSAARGYLSVEASAAPVDTLWPAQGDVPDVASGFAVRFRGSLVPPTGADHVVVDVAADDVGVVFLDGAAVASADGEYATDFLRLDKVPATSDAVAVTPGRAVPVEIVVADGDGAYSWSVRFRFDAGDVTVLSPEAVTQREFEVIP